jgi:hypothetical protein
MINDLIISEFRKGQALQFNWLYEKGALVLHSDGKFSVDFTKVIFYTFNYLFILLPLLTRVCIVEG